MKDGILIQPKNSLLKAWQWTGKLKQLQDLEPYLPPFKYLVDPIITDRVSDFQILAKNHRYIDVRIRDYIIYNAQKDCHFVVSEEYFNKHYKIQEEACLVKKGDLDKDFLGILCEKRFYLKSDIDKLHSSEFKINLGKDVAITMIESKNSELKSLETIIDWYIRLHKTSQK